VPLPAPIRRAHLLGAAVAVLLQSCVAFKSVENELPGLERPSQRCTHAYAVSYDGYALGLAGDRLEKDARPYVADTKEVLANLGCDAIYVKDESKADLRIKVVPHALPQMDQFRISVMVFGTIPVWGTATAFTYVIEDERSRRSNTYQVDETIVAYIFLLPVAWISYFTNDGRRTYREALRNFLTHS
jgi:hypothetical protein